MAKRCEKSLGGGQYGERSAHVEQSTAGEGQTSQGPETNALPRCRLRLVGNKELPRDALGSVLEKAPPGAEGLPLSFHQTL